MISMSRRRRQLLDYVIIITLSLSVVLFGSIADGREKRPEPFSAIVTWMDGSQEVINAQSYQFCSEISEKIHAGLWKPVGKDGIGVKAIECHGVGVIPGGECIPGYRGPRSGGVCK